MNVEQITGVNYKCALYLRLSSEDGDKEESESISNQRKILTAFANENKFEIYDEYIDDGYSGTNFDRPDFKRMIKDIENKKVNMVITKSLSRLGRDYIETGKLIEKYFPENEVRYIAILDDVDTLLDSSTDFVALKNLMNDFYAKETSRNIKKTKNRKREKEGFYYITQAPYGYKKIDIKGNIEIKEDEATIVRRIFNEFAKGKGTYQIAKGLTSDNILTPGLSMKLPVAVKRQTDITTIWDCNQVKRILQNPIYIGTTVQNKRRKISYKSKKKIRTRKEEYIYNENHHEPIIDITLWENVQNILKNNKNQKIKSSDELLKPFLYCHHCHNKLAVVHRKRYLKERTRIDTYIICSTATNKKSNKVCYKQYTTYHIVEKKVIDAILTTIKQYIESNAFDSEEALKSLIQTQKGKKEIDEKINKLRNELEIVNKKNKLLYDDRLNGIIQEEDFLLFSNGLNSERDKIKVLLEEAEDEAKQLILDDKAKRIKEDIKKILDNIVNTGQLKKEDLGYIIKRIEIDKDKYIIIEYNFLELNLIGKPIEYAKTAS